MMSEIAVIIARQRGLYLAEEIDSLAERESQGPWSTTVGMSQFCKPVGA